MTILIISMIRDPWGGSEEILLPFAREAIKNKHELIHSTFRFEKIHWKEQELIKLGVKYITRRGYVKSETFRPLRIAKKAINLILNLLSNPFSEALSHRPDYILYNGTAFSITEEKYLLKILLKKNIPFGIIGHYCKEDGSDLNNRHIELYKQISSNAKNLFFDSLRTARMVEKRINKTLTNFQVNRNPVNMVSTDYVEFPECHTACFAMVGYIRNIHKGHDIIFNVLLDEKWKKRDWHLNIFGTGGDRIQLEKKIIDAGISNKVTFWGGTDDIRKVWADNQLLIMPSRMEGMPLAVVEAMICGRAVVATDVGGHKEWIREGLDGWIAEKAEYAAVAVAMEKAWNNRDKWKKMGINARDRALLLYDKNPGLTLLNHITKN
jgi:glycosyltransferase involved in cell wall biosynthesis